MLLILTAFAFSAVYALPPIEGIKCSPNQVVNRLTVYENGALEAECGPIPCGESGRKCVEDQISCKSETDVFSGMKWANNGQSVLMRCCNLKTSNKIYVGTDIIGVGSYYQGGPVAKKDHYGTGPAEHDFISNIRVEQGGIRIWVHRIMCAAGEEVVGFGTPGQLKPVSRPEPEAEKEREQEEETDEEEEGSEEEDTEEEETTTVKPKREQFNPLRYRPSRVSTGVKRA